jgi:hypothetical protein
MDECQDLKFSGFGGTPGMSGLSMMPLIGCRLRAMMRPTMAT